MYEPIKDKGGHMLLRLQLFFLEVPLTDHLAKFQIRGLIYVEVWVIL